MTKTSTTHPAAMKMKDHRDDICTDLRILVNEFMWLIPAYSVSNRHNIFSKWGELIH